MKALALCLWFASTAVADPVPVEVTAKIVAMPEPTPDCGYFMFKAVVRYQVISVDKGAYKSNEVLAVEICPEMLSLGMQRRMTLIGPAKGSYLDDFKKRPGTRWEVSSR